MHITHQGSRVFPSKKAAKMSQARMSEVNVKFFGGKLKKGPIADGCNIVIWTVILFLASHGAAVFAQSHNTGTIVGNVTDMQSYAVSNAVATLTRQGEAKSYTVKTNEKGEYLFTEIPAGTYTLNIQAPGFEQYVVDSIAVDADQNVRLDAHLQIGSDATKVVVEAEGTTVDTRSATVGMVIENKLVEDLPIDGQNVVALSSLLPGVTNVNAPTTFTSDTGGPTFNVSGSRANQNLFLLDGFMWNNIFYNTGLNYPPPQALQEVSVQLNNYKAQYGRSAGSIYNALTKAGTNSYHGSIWEYAQNSAFNAADYIYRRNPHLVQNQFGATLGGPALKNKLFFFLTFQDLRQAGLAVAEYQTFTYEEQGLISPNTVRPCISSAFSGMNCASFANMFIQSNPNTTININQVLQNPVYSSTYGASAINQLNSAYHQQGGSGTSPCVQLMTTYMNSAPATTTKRYLPNAEMPSVCFNTVATNFITKYLPIPNLSQSGAQPEAVTAAKQPRSDYNGMARIDANFGSHTIDARFYVTNVYDVTSNSMSQGQGVPAYAQSTNTGGIYAGGIGDTWVINNNTLNILRAGYKRYGYNISPNDHTTLQDLGSALTVPGTPSLPEMEATNQFTVGSSNSGRSYTLNANYEAHDTFSLTKGTHSIQAGVQFLDMQYIHRFDQVAFLESEQQNTEASLGDFLLGLVYSETFGNGSNISATQHAFYFYGQDDWRITPKMTLNYGLRYELPFQWYQNDRQSLTFIPGYQSLVFPNAPASSAYVGDPGILKSIVPTRYNDFAPRFGFAYDVFGNGKLSVRGGFGIFFDNVNANVVGIGQPYHYTATYSQPSGGFSNPLLGDPQIPGNYQPGNPQFALPYTINFADKNLTMPYVEAFNLGIQQQVTHDATLEMNYIGKLGRHQMIQFDLNPAIYDCSGGYYQINPTVYCADASTSSSSYMARVKYPGYNYGGQGVVDNATVATSNYNGLQVIYRQRSRKSLTTQISYTYSRSLDLQSNGQTNTAHVPMPFNLRSQYGPSDFQATHVLNIGWVYNLPKFHISSHVMNYAANGWRVGGTYTAHTGNPINIYIAGDASLTDDRPQRPNLVPGVNPNLPSNRHRADKVNEWFNTTAFSTPATGTFGNVGRNSLYGPAFINTNASVGRFFPIPLYGINIEFKADAFNLFNTPNLNAPNTQLASSTSAQGNFGTIKSTVGTNGVVGTNGRRLQLSLILRY